MNFDHLVFLVARFASEGLLNLNWWQLILVALLFTHITIVGVTLYLHRCQAHRALDMSPVLSHFFRFWLWMTTGMGTKEWAAIHRKHHAKCETEEDPHSPQTFGLKKVLWEGAELYQAEAKNQETLDKYGHGCPDDWIERKLYTPLHWLGVTLMLIVNIALFGVAGLAIWGVQMAWIPFFAAGIINGVGHFHGYRNFDSPDASANISPIGILIGGEELHNNHHAFATSAKFSNKWYEFDIGWMYITIASWFGLITPKKVAPTPKLGEARMLIDGDAVQAVIHHRYDLMAAYAKSLKAEIRNELKLRRERAASYAIQAPAETTHERHHVRAIKRWLHLDNAHWPEAQKVRFQQFVEQSPSINKLVEMRQDLGAVWARSSETKEQLVARLENWCQRAEASGVPRLQELARRLRRYSIA